MFGSPDAHHYAHASVKATTTTRGKLHPGQLGLKGARDHLLETCGDRVPQQAPEHRDVCGDVHRLRIHLHVDPAPTPFQPDLAAVGGPLHTPHQGAKPTRHCVDGGR